MAIGSDAAVYFFGTADDLSTTATTATLATTAISPASSLDEWTNDDDAPLAARAAPQPVVEPHLSEGHTHVDHQCGLREESDGQGYGRGKPEVGQSHPHQDAGQEQQAAEPIESTTHSPAHGGAPEQPS